MQEYAAKNKILTALLYGGPARGMGVLYSVHLTPNLSQRNSVTGGFTRKNQINCRFLPLIEELFLNFAVKYPVGLKNREEKRLMERNRKGDLAEILAVSWLWQQGYEVFRNTGCTGPIDIVVYMEGKTKLVDVKGVRIGTRPDGRLDYCFSHKVLTEQQKEMGVKPLWVDIDKGIVGWNRDYFPDPE